MATPWKRLEKIAYMILEVSGCNAMPSCISKAEVDTKREGKQFDALGFHKNSGLMVLVECKERKERDVKIQGKELNNFLEKVENYDVNIGWIVSSTNKSLESHLTLESIDEKYRLNLRRIENNPNSLVFFDWKNKQEKFITMWGYNQLFDYSRLFEKNSINDLEKLLFPYATIKRIQNLPFKKRLDGELDINSADFGLKNNILANKPLLVELLDVLDIAYIKKSEDRGITDLNEKPFENRIKNSRILKALDGKKYNQSLEVYKKLMENFLALLKQYNNDSLLYKENEKIMLKDIKKMYSFEHLIIKD